jgi:hypothetical protein
MPSRYQIGEADAAQFVTSTTQIKARRELSSSLGAGGKS